MVYVRVDVDASDVLEEVSDRELTREVERRQRQAGKAALVETPPQDRREAEQSLDDAAFALRQAGKVNLAWRLDEIRHDYFKEKV